METSAARSRPLKVGIHLPEVERVVPWRELADMCRLAEDVGFDSIWVPDHLVYHLDDVPQTMAPWEGWSTLSAVAAITKRVEIGPLVLCANFRNPALVAKMAETVDEISGGRLVLGLGSGWHEPEFRAFGFPYEERFGRFTESFTIISTLLREGKIDHAGKYFTLRECELHPRGPRPGGIPLMIGSRGALNLRHTLPHVQSWNGWYVWNENTPEGLAPLTAEVDAACAETGTDPNQIERTVAALVRVPGLPLGANAWPHRSKPIEGTAEQVADALRAFAGVGISHLQLVLDPNTPEGIERFAQVLELLDRG